MIYQDIAPESLQTLGDALQEANWQPDARIAEPFSDDDEGDRSRWTAIQFLRQYDSKIRNAVCKDQSVKVEIQTATSIASGTADALQAAGGFPIPTWSVANALCNLGLTKYCAYTPN